MIQYISLITVIIYIFVFAQLCFVCFSGPINETGELLVTSAAEGNLRVVQEILDKVPSLVSRNERDINLNILIKLKEE